MSEKSKFNDQAFLFDFLSDILATENIRPDRVGRQYTQKDPKQIFTINQNLPPKRSKEILSLTTQQLSYLVPKVRLYKITKGKDKKLVQKEFKFTSSSTEEDIVNSIRGRGNDVGLLSFVWSDTGTNPANSGLSFQCEMKLHFQSFDAIFHSRGAHPPFSDLFVPTGTKRNNDQLKTTYDDADFQIKAKVGWAIPNDPGGQIYDDPSIIRNTQVDLIMTLISHDIDIKEYGAVEVTLKYVAAIEGRFLSPKANLLTIPKIDDEELEIIQKKIRLIRALKRAMKTSNKIVEEVIKAADETPDALRPGRTTAADSGAGSQKPPPAPGGDDALVKNKKRAKQLLEATIKALELDKKRHIFGGKRKTLSIKSEIFKTILTQIKDKIYFIDLSKSAYEQYVDIQSIRDRTTRPTKTATAEQIIAGRKPGERYDVSKTFSETIQEVKRLKQLTVTMNNGIKIEKDRAVLPPAATYNLNFVFLGDIIDSVLKIYKDKNKNSIDDFSFTLGSVPVFDITSEKYKNIMLKDIPISLKYYESWFRQNVLNKNMQTLSLQFYLKSLCSSLVYSVLNKIRFQNSSPIKPRLSYITTYGKKKKEAKKISQQHYIYTGGYGADKLKGNRVADAKIGIFHLYVGADRGLVKNIKFERTDLPGLREARIDSSRNLASTNLLFSDFYKAKVSLFGNTIFKPGMIVYINTTAIGLAPTGENTKRIGLSGYYNVIKTDNAIDNGKFETNLELMSLGNKERFQKINSENKFQKTEGGIGDIINNQLVQKTLKDAPKFVKQQKKAKLDAQLAKNRKQQIEGGGDGVGP